MLRIDYIGTNLITALLNTNTVSTIVNALVAINDYLLGNSFTQSVLSEVGHPVGSVDEPSDDEGHLQVMTSSICINEESLYKIHVFQIAHIGL